ncbi:hypothetical protein D3C71_2197640 [compost metagenome]
MAIVRKAGCLLIRINMNTMPRLNPKTIDKDDIFNVPITPSRSIGQAANTGSKSKL